MMNPITMASRVERVVGYASTMVDLYVELDQKVEILESFATQELVERLTPSFGAKAFDALVNIVIADIVRSSWALMLDRSAQSPSVRNVWALASHADLLVVLRERFMAVSPAEAGGQRFDEMAQSMPAAIGSLIDSPLAQFIKTVRHKDVAHHEMQHRSAGVPTRFDVAALGIPWEAPRQVLDLMRPVLADLAQLVTARATDFEAVRTAHYIDAQDFWLRVTGLGKIEPGAS